MVQEAPAQGEAALGRGFLLLLNVVVGAVGLSTQHAIWRGRGP